MKTEKAMEYIKGILLIGGAIFIFQHVVGWFQWLDADYRVEAKEEAVNERITSAYVRGMLWGEENARLYELEPENKFPEMTANHKREIAQELLAMRFVDYVCLGPEEDDCMELPTEEQLMKTYDTKNEYSRYQPVYAFESGFVDAFVNYFER